FELAKIETPQTASFIGIPVSGKAYGGTQACQHRVSNIVFGGEITSLPDLPVGLLLGAHLTLGILDLPLLLADRVEVSFGNRSCHLGPSSPGLQRVLLFQWGNNELAEGR